MTCPRGCCGSYREHLLSVGFRPATPQPKVTVDHTDNTINTVTEHWNDRTDVNVNVIDPVTMSKGNL